MVEAQQEGMAKMARWTRRLLQRYITRAWSKWVRQALEAKVAAAVSAAASGGGGSGVGGGGGEAGMGGAKVEALRNEVETLKGAVAAAEAAAATEATAAAEATARAIVATAAMDHSKVQLKSIEVDEGPLGIAVGMNPTGYASVRFAATRWHTFCPHG